jgi:hypothetical protein
MGQVFYILHLKHNKKYIVVPKKQWVVGVDDVEDEEEYNQCEVLPSFVDTKRINIIETKISYSNVILYARTSTCRCLVVVFIYSMYYFSSDDDNNV